MSNAIDIKLEELRECLYEDDDVKLYFACKDAIKNDRDLIELNQEMRAQQKVLSLSINDMSRYESEKAKYKMIKNKYESNSLVQAYLSAKENVYNLLKQISNMLSE